MIEKWSEVVIRHRILVILTCVILLVGVSVGIKNTYFDSATEIWFLEDDPVLVNYDTLKDRFGSDDYLIVGVESAGDKDDVLNKDIMTAMQKITDFLEEHAAVDKVRSLTKYQYIHYEGDILHVEDVFSKDIDNYELSVSQWDEVRSILGKETLAHDLLFTPDLKHAVVSARVVPVSDYTGGDNPTVDLATEFLAFVEKEKLDKYGDFNLHISGSAAIKESFFRVSMIDQSVSYPIMMTLIVLFLFVFFRNWSGTLLPIGIMAMSTAACLGFIGYLGWAMNMLNVVIPTILTVVALSGAMHILVGFYNLRNLGLSPTDAASKALTKYFKPCFFASLTTAVGFLALTSSKLAPVVELGYAMVVGVMVAFVLTVTFLPAVLSFTSVKTAKTKRLVETGFIAGTLTSLPDRVFNSRKAIVIGSVILIVGVLYYCMQVVVDTNFVRYFKEDTSIRNGLEYIDKTYKGALSLEFMLDSGKEDGIKEPAFMQRALEFQNYVVAQEGTGKANSMVNYIMKINQVMHDDDPAYFKVPDTREMVSQYLLLYSSNSPDEDLSDLMTYYGRYMKISVLFEVAPSGITKARVQAIEDHIQEYFPDLKIETSGRAVLFNNMDNYVLEGLISSFSIAILIIALCLFLVFRSIRYGFLALVPNVVPILFAGAVMGVFGIYLDFSTMVVAAATFGIAVDDTIHFMSQYVSARRDAIGPREAATRAIRTTGPAIVCTSIILLIGFSALVISSFVPNVLMGILGCVVILFALISDLIVLPAMVTLFGCENKADKPSADRDQSASDDKDKLGYRPV